MKAIELYILDLLQKKLKDTHVLLEDNGTAKRFVLLEKIGESTRDELTTVTLAVKSHGEKLRNAINLSLDVRGAMRSINNESDDISIKLIREYNFTDTQSRLHRYQSIYELTYNDVFLGDEYE